MIYLLTRSTPAYFAVIALAISFFLFSRTTVAQDNPCETVTCSNHGVCVMKNDNPVCACDEGFIADPTTGLACNPVATTTAEAAPKGAAPAAPLDDGWAYGASIAGFVSLAPFLALGIATIVTTDNWDYESEVPTGLGAGAYIIFMTMGPVVAAGGKSARRGAGVEGLPGLRIGAWVGYGLTGIAGLVAIGLGAADEPLPKVVPALLVSLGAISLTMFSVEALLSHKQAREKIEGAQSGWSKRSRVALVPVVAPLVTANRGTGMMQVRGATLGLGGTF